MSKQNILIVTRNLPPLVGGMERLIWHVIDELRLKYKVHVIGPVGCKYKLSDDVNVVEVKLRPMFLFFLEVTIGSLCLAMRYRPTIVFAGSGLTGPFVWLIARLFGSKCMVYLHGLDIKVQNRLYQTLWLPFFRGFDGVIVNSRYTKQLALEIKIKEPTIAILHPGVVIPDMTGSEKRNKDFRSRYKLGLVPVMLYVGRIIPRKGLLCFVKDILPQVIAEVPDSVLVVIGDDPIDALHKTSRERMKVSAALQENGLASKVYFLGKCSDEELDNAYFAADLLVFPVQQSNYDIEGFGMVAVEAAAHGLPTVGFAVAGVVDAVADGCSGVLIHPGDNLAFSRAVSEYLTEKSRMAEQTSKCREFAELFRWKAFGESLIKIFQNIKRDEGRFMDK